VKAVVIISKDIRLLVSALRHMMGATRHNNPRPSWHVFPGWSLQQEGQIRRATSIKGHFSLLCALSKQKKFLSVPLFVIVPGMREFTWSPKQKKAARAAFDLAIEREVKSIRDHVQAMLGAMTEDRMVWKVEDYLSEKRREVDQKYDYRYSVLMWVFPRLVAEGWLKIEELSDIGEEKVEVLRMLTSLGEDTSR
jgi:hypothetical protein